MTEQEAIPTDTFSAYQVGLRQLLEKLGRDHPRYSEALPYQSDDPTDATALALLARAAYFAPGEPIPRDLLLTTVTHDSQLKTHNSKLETRNSKLKTRWPGWSSWAFWRKRSRGRCCCTACWPPLYVGWRRMTRRKQQWRIRCMSRQIA
jgi:hypothetical protein